MIETMLEIIIRDPNHTFISGWSYYCCLKIRVLGLGHPDVNVNMANRQGRVHECCRLTSPLPAIYYHIKIKYKCFYTYLFLLFTFYLGSCIPY